MNISSKIKIIHASGTDLLTETQKQLTNRLLNEYYKRIQRQLKNQVSIEFHIKTYEHAGKQNKKQKFSIHVRVKTQAKIFEADYADWELERTIHIVMNKLMNEIEHLTHASEKHLKPHKPQQVRKR